MWLSLILLVVKTVTFFSFNMSDAYKIKNDAKRRRDRWKKWLEKMNDK